MTDMQSQEAEAVLHCQGRLMRINDSLLDETGELLHVSSALPGAHELRLQDIGREGRRKADDAWVRVGMPFSNLAVLLLLLSSAMGELIRQHSIAMMTSADDVYGALNADASVRHYGPSFQLLQVRQAGESASLCACTNGRCTGRWKGCT